MIDNKFLNEDGSMNIEKIDSLPLREHIRTLESFSLEESIEYGKFSKPRGINESDCSNYVVDELTEEEFNTLDWVDADSILDEIDKMIENGRKER